MPSYCTVRSSPLPTVLPTVNETRGLAIMFPYLRLVRTVSKRISRSDVTA
jgi:hypothetical protein